MIKKIISVFLALCLCAGLSGCSISGYDAKSLMSPPKANEDQQAIHKLLQGTRTDITFVYPQSGEYRSAIIMRDFTGDGFKDAMGFCSLEDGGVEVQFMTKEMGEWRTISSYRNAALQVDRVCFGDVTGSGINSVIIGWGSASGVSGRTANACAYVFHPDGEIKEYPLGYYGELTYTDFNEDGIFEVFTVDKFLASETEGEEAEPAMARVYAWTGERMEQIYSTEADNSVSNYSQALFGKFSFFINGVALDCVKADGSLMTQMFYTDENDNFTNYPAGVNTEEYSNISSRPSAASILSRDVNGDGYIEVPHAVQLPCLGEDASLDSTSFLVEWYAMRPSTGGRVVLYTLTNTVEGYRFRLPAALKGKVTATNDPARRTTVYTEVRTDEETGEQLLGNTLFAVKVFTRSSWDARGETSGYTLLATQNDMVYGLQTYTRSERMRGYIRQMAESFQIISE